MVRIKNRWLLVQIRFENEDLNGTNPKSSENNSTTPIQLLILRAIRESIQIQFGDLGSGAFGGSIAIRYYSPITKNAIIRCSRLGLKEVWSAITMCSSLQDKRKLRMIVLHTGGTIRKVQKATIRQDRKQIERLFAKRKQLAKQQAIAASATQSNTLSIIQDLKQSSSDDNEKLDQLAKEALLQSKREIEAIEQ